MCPCLFAQDREEVIMEMSGAEPGCQHFEQQRHNNMWFKVGDCVYIQSHGLSKPRVARLVKILLLFLPLIQIDVTWSLNDYY